MEIKAVEVKPGKPLLDAKGKKMRTAEEYVINPLVEYVKPYSLVPDNAALNPTFPEQVVVPAGGQSADVRLRMFDEGLFEGAYITSDRSTNLASIPELLVELIDDQRHVSLTGRPCHFGTIIGDGQRPFVLPESVTVDKRQSLLLRFHSLELAEKKVRFQLSGQRIYSEQVRSEKLDRYIERRRKRSQCMAAYMCPLDVNPIVLAAGATEDFYFTNDYNIFFEIHKITVKWIGSISTSDRLLKYQIIDEKSDDMSSGWVEVNASMGSAAYPFIFYGPWMVKPGGKLTFRIQSFAGVQVTAFITLSGRQHFVYPGS